MTGHDTVLLSILATFVAFVTIAAFVGRRQRREGGGSLRRLLAVSVGVAALGVAPLLAALALDVADVSGPEHRWGAAVSLAAGGFVLLLAWLQPPMRFTRGGEALPPLEDPALLARIAELASRLGMPCPRARVLYTTGGSLTVQAVVGGLPAPSLVVTDGLLHRLAPEERDAVLEHELGHLSTNLLWPLVAIGPLCTTIAVLATSRVTWLAAAGLALLAHEGLRRVIGRRVEVACDLAAGRVVGHVHMAAAVHKIHAAHSLPRTGWLQVLVHATSTHPALPTRRRALWLDAPRDEQPRIAVDWRAAKLAHATAHLAFFAWLAALASIPVLGTPGAAPTAAWGIGLIGAFLPSALLLLALRPLRRVGQRRLGGDQSPGRWFLLATTAALVLTGALLVWRPEKLSWALMAFGLVVVFAVPGFLLRSRRHRARQEVAIALHRRDWSGAVAVARARPRDLAADRALQVDVALAVALAGDRAGGLAALEALGADPAPLPVALLCASIVAETVDPGRAVRAAERAVALLSQDAGALGVLARALRRAGRQAEAATPIEQALALDPEAGVLHAIQGALALDRGDVAVARAMIERALELSPGEAFTLVVRAEVALAGDDAVVAATAVADAVSAARAAPFTFLDDAARTLEERLNARPRSA